MRLFRADSAIRSAGLYAPLLVPYHGNQVQGMGDLDGLFSKLVKAVAKPFQKIFPAKTLLGKVMDPLGLTDPKRNLNLVGRIADVVGTAATVVAGGWALGAATGGTAGGFWATAGAGAKVAGAAIGKGASWLGSGIGSVAKAAAPLLMTGAFGGANPVQQVQEVQAPQYGLDSMIGGAQAWDGSGGAAYGGGGSSGGWGASAEAQNMPGATVEVTDAMPSDGPNWLLIGGAAVAIFFLINAGKKKGGSHAR